LIGFNVTRQNKKFSKNLPLGFAFYYVVLRPVSIAVALPARAERALKICSRGRDGRRSKTMNTSAARAKRLQWKMAFKVIGIRTAAPV
jgi:hypothetical protein